MPLSDHKLAARKKYIGSSDAPAICGVSPWSNPGQVYLEKTADMSEEDETPAMERGTYVERSILDWFADHTGKKIVRNQYRVADNGIQCANLDAIVENEAIVEAKSGSDMDGWWGAVPSGLPDHVRVQAAHQMQVTGLKLVYVPALIVEFGRPVFRLYEQPWVADLDDAVLEAEFNFWKHHVKKGVPPPEIPPLDVLKRVKRLPNKSVVVADELVLQWQQRKDAEKNAKAAAKEAESALLAALGDADEGVSNLGRVTYFETQRAAYSVEATSFRTLKMSKPKNKEK